MARQKRWNIAETVAVANAVHAEGVRHTARLKDRGITPAFLSKLQEQVRSLQDAASGQTANTHAQKSTTRQLGALIERASRLSGGIREAIRRTFPDQKPLHQAFGVGGATGITTLPRALEAVDTALKGAASYPSQTAMAGILPRDLASLAAVRAELIAADMAQEGAKGTRKSGTAAVDSLQRSVIEAVDRLLAAAAMEFAEEPASLTAFRGPIPTKRRKASAPPAIES